MFEQRCEICGCMATTLVRNYCDAIHSYGGKSFRYPIGEHWYCDQHNGSSRIRPCIEEVVPVVKRVSPVWRG